MVLTFSLTIDKNEGTEERTKYLNIIYDHTPSALLATK